MRAGIDIIQDVDQEITVRRVLGVKHIPVAAAPFSFVLDVVERYPAFLVSLNSGKKMNMAKVVTGIGTDVMAIETMFKFVARLEFAERIAKKFRI